MVRSRDVRNAFFYVTGKEDVITPVYDGGRDKWTGKNRTDKWKKVADFLNKKQCDDVYGFIYANLHFRSDLERAAFNLLPIHLYSEAAWKAYELYQKDLEDLPLRVSAELDALKSRIKYWEMFKPPKEATKKALEDETLSISPFIRHYMSRELGFPEIAEKYALQAEYQYTVGKPAYDKVLKNMQPGEERWKA